MRQITVLTRGEPCSLPLDALQACAPDLARAFANDAFREARTLELDWRDHDLEAVRAVVAWMKARWVHEAAEAKLAQAESGVQRRPLESLSQSELARLFAHHGLSERQLLLTSRDKDTTPTAQPQAVPPLPLVRRTPPRGFHARKRRADDAALSPDVDTEWPIADGRILGHDMQADTFIFCKTYASCRPRVLLQLAHTWRAHGVDPRKVSQPAALAASERARDALVAERDAASAAVGAAVGAATSGADACLGTLRLARYLSLDGLVRAAVDAVGDALDVGNAVSLLGLADELGCAPLRERVSGFVVAHIAEVAASAHWAAAVPPHEQQRLLALAAAARANPLGLGLGRDATHDARELVATADEVLLAQRERLAEAEAALARERRGEGADHAERMLDRQRDRIAVLDGYVAAQRAALKRRDRDECSVCS